MKIFNNKSGQATMLDNYIYAIASFFIIVVLGNIMIEYVVIGNLQPILTNSILASSIDSTTQNTIFTNYTIIKNLLRALPFAIWFIIIIWLFVINARVESQDF